MKKNIPEIGQAFFGNPTSEYDCPQYIEALVMYLLDNFGRVYGNRTQKTWDHNEMDGKQKLGKISFRSYYWGESSKIQKEPNFKFENVEIRWYKHPLRGMSINVHMRQYSWISWFNRCLKEIRKHDTV